MNCRKIVLGVFLMLFTLSVPPCFSQIYQVHDPAELKAGLSQLKPGDELQISPGVYRGIFLKNIHGTAAAPIIIMAEDPFNPPIFKGGTEGMKLSSCSYLKFKNLVFRDFSTNGINIDDDAKKATSHHLILEQIQVLDTGGKRNQNAVKLSGVTDFVLRQCSIEGWGGSAVDLVGCSNGIIEDCIISGKQGFRSGNGIQIKGGSHAILVQGNVFREAGQRAVQIGGLTGKAFFRPAVGDYEAKNITVAGNTFIGSEAQIAWVTAQDSHVHNNLFFLPEKWLGRILQETQDQQFKPSQRGLFERNIVVTDQRVNVFFNVGRGTDPESFVFQQNLWFRPDGKRKPTLPSFEKDGVYDVDPMIIGTEEGGLQINSAAPELQQIGPEAYRPWSVAQDFADVTVPRVNIPAVEYSTLDWIKALLE
ncbi:right-handed parallel beta-helix repeat-containing protein [Syntrophotalea acetylenica]|uniref:right-handed parallel beta-helix repeat-containing protein n=1 Tax=Syntrophotalea acetylenica TaxID=29542 RepID=UPI002A36CCAE|nr:right-handed parallel beta-helix repeat-containing protein [Syntrophotalea acetylenica]MDY0263345.1 right-handed parallel beta-helix repeat-containing protein [Syntrophotalea acetylenica]